MPLFTGNLFWPAHSPAPRHFPKLDRNISADVVVVGAGVTGAIISHALINASLDTVLLDKRTVACGSTAANTALLLYELDTTLGELIRIRGEAQAVRVYHLCVDAVDAIGRLVASLHIPCDFAYKPSVYLAGRTEEVAELNAEYETRKRFGIPSEFLDHRQLQAMFSFARPAAILSPNAAQFDPCRFAHELVNHCANRGLQVFERTSVNDMRSTARGVCVLVNNDWSIQSSKVILATGYECAGDFARPLVRAHNTYAVVSEPIDRFDGWWDRCLIWESARPYMYLRTTADGRAMIGGDDDECVDPPSPTTLQQNAQTLQQKFARLFPKIKFRPAAAWSGTFKNTSDGLPFIGPRPNEPNILYALGYGGNGTTFAPIAARILRDLCLGRENPDVELFRFDRR